MKFFKIAFSFALLSTIVCACSHEPKFKVSGEVEGAEGESLVLEKSDFYGRWIAVDSTRVKKSGSFEIKADAPASPEIYRLSLGDRFIYFPIDSIESLKIKSSSADFGSKFELTGTPMAENLAAFERELLAMNATDSASLANFKRDVYSKYIKDNGASILSYYVLTKIYNGRPLYDPATREDAKYYAAVATQFELRRPNDPHGRMVHEVAVNAMRNHNVGRGAKNVMEATELKIIDIALPDADNVVRKLSDYVGKGKPVVVVFSMMNAADSPNFNRQLAQIYNSKAGAVEFYQISFDTGQYEWRNAVRSLPWVNVIDPNGTASNALRDYNVGTLPAVFIYNAAGELTDRPESLDDLAKKLR